jgi:hypothetical protein
VACQHFRQCCRRASWLHWLIQHSKVTQYRNAFSSDNGLLWRTDEKVRRFCRSFLLYKAVEMLQQKRKWRTFSFSSWIKSIASAAHLPLQDFDYRH